MVGAVDDPAATVWRPSHGFYPSHPKGVAPVLSFSRAAAVSVQVIIHPCHNYHNNSLSLPASSFKPF